MITTLGRHPVCYATSPFRPADAAESAGGPRAIIVNSPHNPVGMVLDHSQLRQLEAICAAHPRLTIISDETYEGLVFDGTTHTSPATLPGLTGTTIVVRSFSKTYSMPGWRVGYLAAPEPLTAKIRRFHLAMNSFSPAMSQHTARWALDQGDAVPRALCARYEANRNYLAARLRDIAGFSCVPSQGTLYLFPALSGNTRTAADKLARCYGVHLCPGEMFGSLGQGHLRICLALEDDVLRELCRRIVMFAEDF